MSLQGRAERLPWANNPGSILGRVALYAGVLAMVLWTLLPFAWLFISSVSPQVELIARPPHWIPENWTWSRYVSLVTGKTTGTSMPMAATRFAQSLVNSLGVASMVTVLSLATGFPAAYVFSRFRRWWTGKGILLILVAQMVPAISVAVPIYLVLARLGLIDTRLGLTAVYTGMMLPAALWILYGYVQSIPRSIDEAAMIDGCTRMGTIRYVVLPLASPGLVAAGSFAFLSSWNEFFFALILTSNTAKTTTVTITEFATQFGIDYGLMATGGVLGALPPLILAFFFQRHILDALVAGGVKG